MSDKKNNLRDAIMDLARGIGTVFKKYTRSTREKAWSRITSRAGEKEIDKIMLNPNRQLDIFRKLVNQKEGLEMGKSLKLWVDDERPMPEGFDLHVENADDAIQIVSTGKVSMISLDHDLGEKENGDGYEVAKFIEEAAYMGILNPMEMRVHSANPVGRKRIEMSIEKCNKYWGFTK